MSKKPAFIIVIGTSAGGIKAIEKIVGQFNPDMDAAIFVVHHLSKSNGEEFLVERFQKATALKCELGKEGTKIKKGTIYIAPPNEHLLVKEDHIVLGHGPEENRWRPSIDVLFRSAAAAYNTRVIGIILTGLLNDGTAGMWAIKRSGGTCIVQDPKDAEFPDMPISILDHMDVNYSVPLNEIVPVIDKIMLSLPEEIPAPPDVIAESRISEKAAIGHEEVEQLGQHSIYACPDCGGNLWQISDKENIKRYRCHIGHSYTQRDLLIKQGEALETTLWISLRIMEERRNLLNEISNKVQKKGLKKIAEDQRQKSEQLEVHINKLKEILMDNEKMTALASTVN